MIDSTRTLTSSKHPHHLLKTTFSPAPIFNTIDPTKNQVAGEAVYRVTVAAIQPAFQAVVLDVISSLISELTSI
jgi:hypothetical protein